jgi:hypothetical protein
VAIFLPGTAEDQAPALEEMTPREVAVYVGKVGAQQALISRPEG